MLQQIPHRELLFFMDQRHKVGSKGNIQISGLDRETTNKIAKTMERRAISRVQETAKVVDLGNDSNPDTSFMFSDDSTDGCNSSVSEEVYLPPTICFQVCVFIMYSSN